MADYESAGYMGSGVEMLELHDRKGVVTWEEFQLSGMPEIIGSIHLGQVLLAVSECGILDRIRTGRNSVKAGLLEGLNSRIAENLLRYLEVRGVLSQWEEEYCLTRKGELLTGEIPMARLGFYLEAYGPVTGKVGDLLTGRATYGVEVKRAGGPLSKHCATVFARYYTPIVLEAMRGRGATRALDLGCGGGQLLVDACLNDPGFSGVGIDLAPEAVAAAQDLARRNGVADRLSFFVADAFAPHTWPDACHEAETLFAIGMLHEHFRDGEQAVVDVLNTYADVSGRKMLLVGEPEPRYDDRENDSDFFLVHVLTDQGIPQDRHSWLRVFEQTRLECRRILTPAVAGPRMCFYDLAPAAED